MSAINSEKNQIRCESKMEQLLSRLRETCSILHKRASELENAHVRLCGIHAIKQGDNKTGGGLTPVPSGLLNEFEGLCEQLNDAASRLEVEITRLTGAV